MVYAKIMRTILAAEMLQFNQLLVETITTTLVAPRPIFLCFQATGLHGAIVQKGSIVTYH
jgi:hypothetical protein